MGRLAHLEKSGHDIGQSVRIVLMNHVAGVVDDGALVIRKRIVSLLFVGPPGLPAFFPFDYQHRAFDAAQKFERLGGIKRLGRRGAMERIEFPNPLASVVLFHCGAGQVQSQLAVYPGIGLL